MAQSLSILAGMPFCPGFLPSLHLPNSCWRRGDVQAHKVGGLSAAPHRQQSGHRCQNVCRKTSECLQMRRGLLLLYDLTWFTTCSHFWTSTLACPYICFGLDNVILNRLLIVLKTAVRAVEYILLFSEAVLDVKSDLGFGVRIFFECSCGCGGGNAELDVVQWFSNWGGMAAWPLSFLFFFFFIFIIFGWHSKRNALQWWFPI